MDAIILGTGTQTNLPYFWGEKKNKEWQLLVTPAISKRKSQDLGIVQEGHQLYDQAVKVALDVFYSWTGASVIES